MFCIISLVLIYLITLNLQYLLTAFVQCPFSTPTASDNHKFGLFFYELVSLFGKHFNLMMQALK